MEVSGRVEFREPPITAAVVFDIAFLQQSVGMYDLLSSVGPEGLILLSPVLARGRYQKLIVPQRLHGINLSGVPSWDIAGEERHRK
jgi:hypothetical protein